MAKDLEDYKKDLGKNFFHFWLFKCSMTMPILLAAMLCTALLPFFFNYVLVNAVYLFGSYFRMTAFSAIYSFVFAIPLSLLAAWMHRSTFINKVRKGEPVSYYEYNEYENILHWCNYEGSVRIKKGNDVKEINFN